MQWRSLLYVPVTNERFVAKAHERGADAVILDLEDAIAPSEKNRARDLVAEAAAHVGQAGADVLVRPNRPWRLAVRDLEASIGPNVRGLNLPKVESADHVRALAEIVDELEVERGLERGHTVFVARIESAAGLENAATIARAHPRVVAIGLGSSDYSLSIWAAANGTSTAIASFLIVNAAVAAGVTPIGLVSTIVDYEDLASFRAAAQQSRDLGLRGAPCVHPKQVPILNEIFGPTDTELERATRIVEEYEHALDDGIGAILVDGAFVDAPYYEQAKRLLASQPGR